MTGLLVAMIVFALGRKAGSSGIVFFAGRPFGGLDYVTYLCCAKYYNLYSRVLYDVFGTNFLWLGARAVEGILEAQAESPVEGVFW